LNYSSKPPSSNIVKPKKVPRKGGLLGADITASVAFIKGGCHMSYTTIQQFFKEVMHLDISRGLLSKAA